MSSRRDLRTLVLVAACLATISCSKPTVPDMRSKTAVPGPTQKTPTRLVFDQRLMESNLKLLTAFADINRDGKPDMILGSNGHFFSDKAPRVKESATIGEHRHYVSHLMNVSDRKEIRFDDPYWPNPHGNEGQLPGG